MLHMRYAQYVNRRRKASGHLWQGRFYSTILDEPHVYAAVRYVENNPVRAGVVTMAEEYTWSSAKVHVQGTSDSIVSPHCYLLSEIKSWKRYLREGGDEELIRDIRKNSTTGRPCGDESFIKKLERRFGRRLRALAHGRPRKTK
jgi:putative transposase